MCKERIPLLRERLRSIVVDEPAALRAPEPSTAIERLKLEIAFIA